MRKVLLFQIFMLFSFSDATEIKDLCQGREKVTMAKATLTNEGKAKMITYALEQSKPYLEQTLTDLKFDKIDGSYDREKCKPEIYDKLGEAEKDQISCTALPNFARVGTGKSVPLKGETPFDIGMENVSFSNVKIESFDTECNDDHCDIFIQMESIQTQLDLSLAAVEDNGVESFGAKKLTVLAHKNPKGQGPIIALRAKVGADGNIENFVQIPKEFFGTVLPPGSMRIGVDGSFSIEEAVAKRMKVPPKLQAKMDEASAVIASEIQNLPQSELLQYDGEKRVKELIGEYNYMAYLAYVEKYKDQAMADVTSLFNDGSATTDESGIRDSHSLRMMTLAMRLGAYREHQMKLEVECSEKAETAQEKEACKGPRDAVHNAELLISPIVSRTLNSSLRSPLQEVVNDLDFVHKSLELPLDTVSLQDQINYSKMHEAFYGYSAEDLTTLSPEDLEKKKKGGLLDLLSRDPKNIYRNRATTSDFIESISNAASPDSIDILNQLEKLLTDSKDKVKAFSKGTGASSKGSSKISGPRQREQIDRLLKEIDKAKKKVAREIAEQEANYKVATSIQGFETAAGQLSVLLSGCSTGCEKFTPSPVNTDIDFLNSHKCNKKYDMAASINIDTINKYLASLHKNGYLDICMNHQEHKVCKNAGFFSTKHKLTMTEPPKIKWNSSDETFELVIPKVEREMDAGIVPGFLYCNRDATKLSMKFKPVVHEGGTKIGIKGVDDIKTSVRHDDKSKVCKLLVAVAAPYAAIALEAAHRILHESLLVAKKKDIQGVLEEGIEIPESLPVSSVSCIDGSDNHITVYSNLE